VEKRKSLANAEYRTPTLEPVGWGNYEDTFSLKKESGSNRSGTISSGKN
jgi:hypothetical protein